MLALCHNIGDAYTNMSARDSRNQLFDRMTPKAWKDQFIEHGREIATGISLGRVAMAPVIGFTAARGIKGVAPAMLRGLKIVSDGYDGYVAEKAGNHKTAKPQIKTGPKMLAEVGKVGLSRRPVTDKIANFRSVLRDTDGGAADRDFDKFSQAADQLGCVINRDLTSWSFALNMARIGLIDFGVRPTYSALGVEQIGATKVSQAKTVVHDSHQLLESTGVFDRFPVGRRVLEVASAAMTAASAVDIMRQCEEQYRINQNQPEEQSTTRLCLYALSRTIHHALGVTTSAPQPELPSVEQVRSYEEFPVLPPAASPHLLN